MLGCPPLVTMTCPALLEPPLPAPPWAAGFVPAPEPAGLTLIGGELGALPPLPVRGGPSGVSASTLLGVVEMEASGNGGTTTRR
jgi:hypothetical protein